MKKLTLSLLEVQLLADGGAVLITRPSKENPSANGVHKISAGQFQRIVTRSIGLFNPIAFKALIATCNGSAKLTIEATLCKVGEAWENKVTGEKGTYGINADGTAKEGAKDWTKYSNHAVELGIVGQMKIAELAFGASMNIMAQSYAGAPVVAKQPVAANAENSQSTEEHTDDQSGSGKGADENTPI